MRTFDIEAREYREVRVLGPRGPRAGRLWQACEMRASLLGDASFCVSSSPGRLGEFSFISLWKKGPTRLLLEDYLWKMGRYSIA